MKIIIQRLFILMLFIFSFYYTNKVVELLRDNDPLMKEIKNTGDKYKIEAMDAVIKDNTMMSGKRGKEIDLEKSYHNMKEYGAYNESLTVQKETTPVISINDYYDKYLVSGNKTNKKVALVFINNDHLDKIIPILDKEKVIGTFFIDGTFIENNVSFLKNNKKHEFELLSYKDKYDESFFKTALSYLESITGNKSKYCYTRSENEELLKLCRKLKLHTVMPSVIISNNIYNEVKENLDNGVILSIHTSKIEKELPVVIQYIKEKGYKIVSLEKLLSE